MGDSGLKVLADNMTVRQRSAWNDEQIKISGASTIADSRTQVLTFLEQVYQNGEKFYSTDKTDVTKWGRKRKKWGESEGRRNGPLSLQRRGSQVR
jgi:hypothetical protein